MRTVVIHYHLFKNAGSTIDYLLQHTFADAWMKWDRGPEAPTIRPRELAAYIVDHPDLQALSTHQSMLPLPEVPGVQIVPIVCFRHPLDRARSVYAFERKQGLNGTSTSQGAKQASQLSFADYLQWRFGLKQNGLVHNYQTLWLLHEPRYRNQVLTQKEYEMACRQLKALPYFGLVEAFPESVQLFATQLREYGILLDTTEKSVNATSGRLDSLAQRLDALRHEIGESVWTELDERNRWDCLLHEVATEEFTRRMKGRIHR